MRCHYSSNNYFECIDRYWYGGLKLKQPIGGIKL